MEWGEGEGGNQNLCVLLENRPKLLFEHGVIMINCIQYGTTRVFFFKNDTCLAYLN